ncbi:hypothetical protein LguiA_025975 [Lonicera macranthoides]
MAILAHLYRQLGMASRAHVMQISGCLTLLVAWIADHFLDCLRVVYNMEYTELMPRMCKWKSQQCSGDTHMAAIRLREKLDNLTEKDVIWDPYKDHRDAHPLHEVSYYCGLLLCYDIAEAYYPDHSVPVRYPWECAPDYMDWFLRISHPYVQPPSLRTIPQRTRDVYDKELAKLEMEVDKARALLGSALSDGQSHDIVEAAKEAYNILGDARKTESERNNVEENMPELEIRRKKRHGNASRETTSTTTKVPPPGRRSTRNVKALPQKKRK